MGEQVLTVSAPGKIILHGEHAVVYGKKAIAASLNLRTKATLTVDSSALVKLNLPLINECRQWKVSELLKLKTLMYVDPLKPEPLSSQGHEAIQQFLVSFDKENPSVVDRISLALIFLWKSILKNFDEDRGLNVTLNSDLPLAAGLGSSASVAVCLSAALLKVSGTIGVALSPAHLELINQWAFMVEKIFHGNPSGVDNCTCTYGGAIVYTNGHFDQKQMKFPMRILVVNSMVSRNTKKMVASVKCMMEKYPAIINPILDAMDQIANMFEKTFWQDAMPEDQDKLCETFEDLISINQALLTALGVSHPNLQQIISIVNKYGLQAKLTGAGGGGVVFVLLKPGVIDVLESVKEELGLQCYQFWDVMIGGQGVQIVDSEVDPN